MTLLELLIYTLAVYRMALLLSDEGGPFGMFRKLRAFLKREAKHNAPLRKSEVHHGISCIWCSSIWVAIPLALFAHYHDSVHGWLMVTGDIFVFGMALSAGAILLNRLKTPA